MTRRELIIHIAGVVTGWILAAALLALYAWLSA